MNRSSAGFVLCIAFASVQAGSLPHADTPAAIRAEVEQAAAAQEANVELGDRLSAQWAADLVAALRARGDADGLGLAFIISQGSILAALAPADDNADADAAKIDQIVDDQLNLEAQVIARAGALSLPVLRLLALHARQPRLAQQEHPLTEALIRRAPAEMSGWSQRLNFGCASQPPAGHNRCSRSHV